MILLLFPYQVCRTGRPKYLQPRANQATCLIKTCPSKTIDFQCPMFLFTRHSALQLHPVQRRREPRDPQKFHQVRNNPLKLLREVLRFCEDRAPSQLLCFWVQVSCRILDLRMHRSNHKQLSRECPLRRKEYKSTKQLLRLRLVLRNLWILQN